jgi:hypothetical protein
VACERPPRDGLAGQLWPGLCIVMHVLLSQPSHKVCAGISFPQVFLLVFYAIANWASGVEIRGDIVTLVGFGSFLCGMLAMGNTLLPLREGVYNAIWLGIVKGYFPATTLKVRLLEACAARVYRNELRFMSASQTRLFLV